MAQTVWNSSLPTMSEQADFSSADHEFNFPDKAARMLRVYADSTLTTPQIVMRLAGDTADLTLPVAEGVEYIGLVVTHIRQTTTTGLVVTGFA